MTLYLDSSVLVSAVMAKPRSPEARAVLGDVGSVVASGWTFVEAASALSIKVRIKAITAAEQEAALRLLDRLQGASVPLIGITEAHLREAARYAGRHELNLRGGDALHIALAGSIGATLVTGDEPMSRAAERLGVAVRLLA